MAAPMAIGESELPARLSLRDRISQRRAERGTVDAEELRLLNLRAEIANELDCQLNGLGHGSVKSTLVENDTFKADFLNGSSIEIQVADEDDYVVKTKYQMGDEQRGRLDRTHMLDQLINMCGSMDMKEPQQR